MRTDHYYTSQGAGRIHYCKWLPEGEVKAVLQIVHGIAEYVERYDDFANFLNGHGIAVVAEDHMGHGKSISEDTLQGYFHGGWFTAVDDTYELLQRTRDEFPQVPYILFGHSMGSFMARTILGKYPDSGIAAAIICGTAWQPSALLKAGVPAAKLICKLAGEKKPSTQLNSMIFGSYNKRVEHPRTASDWLSRDDAVVDAYVADPLCGFVPCAGLLRDMMLGIAYVQQDSTLAAMRKDLPVFFIAGGDDPVGAYGEGVRLAAEAFYHAGMEDVSVKIYPLCRHEILNEINREEVYGDILAWIRKKI